MESLEVVRSLLHNQQPGATPPARPNGVSRDVVQYSARVPAFGKQGESAAPSHVQFACKSALAPFLCVETMLLEWMAEPRVLGVKESGDLQEGFGFLVRHLLADGLENAHAEGRRGAGEKGSASVGQIGQAMLAKARMMRRGPGDWGGIMDEPGVNMGKGGDLVRCVNLASHAGDDGGSGTEGTEHRKLAAMFFVGSRSTPTGSMEDAAIEAACERLRQAGMASGVREGRATGGGGLELAASTAPATHPPAPSAVAVSALAGSSLGRSGSTGNSDWLNPGFVPVNGSAMLSSGPSGLLPDNPHGRVLPMRHPVRDLPNLLARFGAVLQPTVGSNCFPEWEEWSEGDEAAMKFPDDSNARCFWLGRAEGRQGLGNNGHVAAAAKQGRTRKARKAPSKEPLPPPRSEMRPIIRCRADADLIVEFAEMLLDPPVCAHCSTCIATYTTLVPFVALVANFADRPASALLDHFVSIFPPHTAEFQYIVNRLVLDGRTRRCSAHALRERVEQVPVSFLLALCLLHPKELLHFQQSGTQGELNS
ncbi:unnamed protein product [Closterium sp. Naga37s-1]|nr:unnamed protein product [Closterium sp. Naga37s-1]